MSHSAMLEGPEKGSPRPVRWVLVAEPIVLTWVAVEVARAFSTGITWADWVRFGFLAVAAALYLLGTRKAEEIRRGRHAGRNHVDHTSLIFFAAALLLPIPLTVVLIGAVRVHRWMIARKPIHKFFHTTVAIWLSALGVHLVAELTPLQMWMTGEGEPTAALEAEAGATLLAAVAAYFVAQLIMVGAVRGFASEVLHSPKSERKPGWRRDVSVDMFGTAWDNAEIIVTLLLAMGIAALAALWLPLLLIVVPVGIFFSVVMSWIDDLRQEASTDVKTGLLTVGTFKKRAAKVLARAARSATPTSVLIIDIDHFKKVNDTYGHFAGDEVLKAVADRLQLAARTGDEVCRFGGEEMLILLPETDLEDALTVAERVRAEVERLSVPVTMAKGGDPVVIEMTVSIGGAIIPTHGADLDTVMNQADAALYAAKGGGRNQVRGALAGEAPS
ncbi:diguanylate cyclase [Amycolatopsis lexingtonensis]|uniref:GGDEF domain-containing protein n=1 Tax=Amycolatopsis lexingtonensis TaxID=218822 RepID=UPI003F70327B